MECLAPLPINIPVNDRRHRTSNSSYRQLFFHCLGSPPPNKARLVSTVLFWETGAPSSLSSRSHAYSSVSLRSLTGQVNSFFLLLTTAAVPVLRAAMATIQFVKNIFPPAALVCTAPPALAGSSCALARRMYFRPSASVALPTLALSRLLSLMRLHSPPRQVPTNLLNTHISLLCDSTIRQTTATPTIRGHKTLDGPWRVAGRPHLGSRSRLSFAIAAPTRAEAYEGGPLSSSESERPSPRVLSSYISVSVSTSNSPRVAQPPLSHSLNIPRSSNPRRYL